MKSYIKLNISNIHSLSKIDDFYHDNFNMIQINVIFIKKQLFSYTSQIKLVR